MKGSVKISVWQLCCLLLLSRLLTTLTFSPVGAEKIPTADYLPAVFAAAGLMLFGFLPVILQRKYFPGMDMPDVAYTLSPALSKCCTVSYTLVFFFLTLVSVARLELFVGSVVFPNNDSAFFVLLFAVAAVYAAGLGLEALGRAGTVCLVLFLGAFFCIVLAMTDKIEIANLSPMLAKGVSPVWTAGLDAATRTVEPALAAVLLPRVSGKPGKALAAGWLCFICFTEGILFYVFAGLGDFALTQMFPVHAVAVLAEFSVFQRFDVLLTGVWILTAFVKVSLLLYLQSELLKKSFSEKPGRLYILLAAAAVLVIQLGFAGKVTDYYFTLGLFWRTLLYAVFVVLIPLVFLLTAIVKKRRRGDAQLR